MLANVFYWLLLMSGGIAILKYRKVIYEWTGGWGWAEHYLGRGGTISALCLIACLMIGLGVVKFFGKIEFGMGSKPPTTQVKLSGNTQP